MADLGTKGSAERQQQQHGAILLDIEGTTTSISFVKDVLFPYAREHLETFLRENWRDGETRGLISDLYVQSEIDLLNGLAAVPQVLPLVDTEEIPDDLLNSVLLYVWWLMDQDRKVTPLKALQGKIWQDGYAKGELKGHIYPDVPVAFIRWTEQGKKLYIYSSGSVQAQKLLFGNSEAGDLCKFLSGYFDTTTGYKTESSSYEAIASQINLPASDILFLTDVPAEGYSARKAGMDVRIMIRPGNKPLSETEAADFQIATTFDDI